VEESKVPKFQILQPNKIPTTLKSLSHRPSERTPKGRIYLLLDFAEEARHYEVEFSLKDKKQAAMFTTPHLDFLPAF